ncbi:MAG TPA: MauE/DoxX family redox-associated membrane protein [Streptosporangiaceae bacterium]|nr:MauE/DoxX family redox-associated membrane protein [Streptosporangiaceae bacterium]
MTELVLAVLALAACVYGTSSGTKLANRTNYAAFRDGLAETSLVPRRLLPATAAVLAGGEAIVAAGLLLALALVAGGLAGSVPVAAAALACGTVLAGVLAAGVIAVVRSGTKASCACFGAKAGRELSGAHVGRNVALLALLIAGLIANAFRHGTPAAPAAAATVVAIVAGAVVALLLIRFDDLVDLFAPVSRPAAR